jgi:hypothetical protein
MNVYIVGLLWVYGAPSLIGGHNEIQSVITLAVISILVER